MPGVSVSYFSFTNAIQSSSTLQVGFSETASLEAFQPLLHGSATETDTPVLPSNANPKSPMWNMISLGQSHGSACLQPEMF